MATCPEAGITLRCSGGGGTMAKSRESRLCKAVAAVKGLRVELTPSWWDLSHAGCHGTVLSKMGARVQNRGPATRVHARSCVCYHPRGERSSAPDILLSQTRWDLHHVANTTGNDADSWAQSLGVIACGDGHQKRLISKSTRKVLRQGLRLEHCSYVDFQLKRRLHPGPSPSHVGVWWA
jgi:hypothetical protein